MEIYWFFWSEMLIHKEKLLKYPDDVNIFCFEALPFHCTMKNRLSESHENCATTFVMDETFSRLHHFMTNEKNITNEKWRIHLRHEGFCLP